MFSLNYDTGGLKLISTMTNFIEPYNPNWKAEFERLKKVLETALIELSSNIDIQHVGSTAIPGMVAKPILDIDIIIDDKELITAIEQKLIEIGYISRGEQGIEGRFAFRQASSQTPFTSSAQNWQKHHLYVCFADSLALKNHLLFRDALINDHALMERYSGLKMSLVEIPQMTREDYTKSKTEFIILVLAEAGLTERELAQIIDANS
jgi:GrpB-like predicted nucleotidyltransferase (UPF0157 family)